MNSLAIKVLSPDQHQVLDVTKCFVTSKNWCQLADKTLMAREFVYFLMNLDCPRTIYKEFIIRYLWTKFFYQYIFQNAVHGTLSFDAHLFGNGMPEEFCFLLLELLAGSWYVLKSHRKCAALFILIQRPVIYYSSSLKISDTKQLAP